MKGVIGGKMMRAMIFRNEAKVISVRKGRKEKNEVFSVLFI